MTKKTLTQDDLRQFVGGSANWYRHGFVRSILYTDGARHVAEAGGAYWLLDEIAFAQRGIPAIAAEPFQVWTLTVRPDRTATLSCEDGNDRVVFTKAIPLTDFPLDQITLWFAENTIYLPDEH